MRKIINSVLAISLFIPFTLFGGPIPKAQPILNRPLHGGLNPVGPINHSVSSNVKQAYYRDHQQMQHGSTRR